ncbi:MAG: histidinolphosphatase [Thelocarpon superellum]|nr:MAG: histidinolphosphatase [Thelocarpon superellum]
MLFSYHSHSGQFCDHAENTLEQMVQAAIAKNMHILALTEHVPRDRHEDLYPQEEKTPEQLFSTFGAYHVEAARLKKKYAAQITLLIGFETEWIRDESRLIVENLQDQYPFDVFVGSIHHADSVPIDFSKELFEEARDRAGGTEKHLFETYFDDQYEMLTALQPPIVGHFDLPRLYSDEPDGSFRRWPTVWEKICRNLRFITEYGGIVELNSSSLRKGMKEPYPGLEICREHLRNGGRFTLSDDSHAVAHVAANYDRVFQFMKTAGVSTVHYLDIAKGAPTEGTTNVEVRSISIHDLQVPSTS